jgi:hypothetical protein
MQDLTLYYLFLKCNLMHYYFDKILLFIKSGCYTTLTCYRRWWRQCPTLLYHPSNSTPPPPIWILTTSISTVGGITPSLIAQPVAGNTFQYTNHSWWAIPAICVHRRSSWIVHINKSSLKILKKSYIFFQSYSTNVLPLFTNCYNHWLFELCVTICHTILF